MPDYYRLPIGERMPEIVTMVVEIPGGTSNKVEYDPVLGVFRLDRPLYSPVHYPGDYGFVPQTHAGDGDPLDILALGTPTFTGCVMQVRPIAALVMADDKGEDVKVVAVGANDPRFKEMTDRPAIPAHVVRELDHFFRIYKELEGKETTVYGWKDRWQAWEEVKGSHEAFRRREKRGRK